MKSDVETTDKRWVEFAKLQKQNKKLQERQCGCTDDGCYDECDECVEADKKFRSNQTKMERFRGDGSDADVAKWDMYEQYGYADWQKPELVDEHCIKIAVAKFTDPGKTPDRWRVYLFADNSVMLSGGGSAGEYFNYNLLLTQYPSGNDNAGCLGQLARHTKGLKK